ncbi:MAG: single-stranded-DNA-specific exonuclease RecJ, partial [Thermoguttaceae bacterium]|nr:single-stranded-DNA-specific exonuclease RecJ [Thermoguttaceae bacterium]
RIAIYGDYDVDGITGTAILWKGIKLLGGDVRYYIPHRIDEGYGLHEDAVRRLASDGVRLLVTVDCGIGSLREAAIARDCGIQLIITDHHEPGARLPDATVIVHPRLPGTEYPFGGLSGSGVALKLAWAIAQRASGAARVSPAMRQYLVEAVGLAALGTVADVVPLVDENRILVYEGLRRLRQSAGLGLRALLDVAKVERAQPDSEDVAFVLGPRLNAAGRLGQAQLAVELLLTDKPERARELAQYLDGLNATRQSLERGMYQVAVKLAEEQFDPAQDAALVLGHHGWHAGVLGIVAGRLAEKYHRPTVLIAWDPMGVKPGIGSARSVPGFPLHTALEACGGHLLGHGGHAAAAGLTIEESKFEAFRAAFCEHAATLLDEGLRAGELLIDAEAPLSAFTLDVVHQIERLAPFGQGNARPLLCTTGVSLAQPPKIIGSGGRHLSLQLVQHGVSLRAIAFGGAEWAEDLSKTEGPFDIAFRPMINVFAGRRSVELRLVDWRAGR